MKRVKKYIGVGIILTITLLTIAAQFISAVVEHGIWTAILVWGVVLGFMALLFLGLKWWVEG